MAALTRVLSQSAAPRLGIALMAGADPTLREYIAAQFAAHAELHKQHEVAHAREHADDELALQKAEVSIDKRLDTMNEIRAQLRDQAGTFARSEAVQAVDEALDRRYEELRTLIGTEREERRANEGIKRGMSQTTAVIVAVITVIGTLLGITVILSNLLIVP